MYDMGCFSTNEFYPTTLSCSSNTSSPDSLKHQRLLVTATPSSPNAPHGCFLQQQQQTQRQQQQYLFDHHRFRFNPNNNDDNNNNNNNDNNNNNNNNNNSNRNLNDSSEMHSSSSSIKSSHDQSHLWLAPLSSGQQPQQSSRFSNDLVCIRLSILLFLVITRILI